VAQAGIGQAEAELADAEAANRRPRDLLALGFPPLFLVQLIVGESLAIACLAGCLGIMLTFPVAGAFGRAMGSLFPVFNVSLAPVALQLACILVVGLAAAAVPSRYAARVNIVDGLRSIA